MEGCWVSRNNSEPFAIKSHVKSKVVITSMLSFLFIFLASCGNFKNFEIEFVDAKIISFDESPHWQIFESEFSQLTSAEQAEEWGANNQQIASLLGREDLIKNSSEEYKPSTECKFLDSEEQIEDAIVRGANNTSIVIINESHINTRHRAFILETIKILQENGYEYYGAETFSNRENRVPIDENTKEYFRTRDGFYLKEAVFGRLGRELIARKMKLFAYERIRTGPPDENADIIDEIYQRENAQAENIIKKLNAIEEDAKIILHVGYSHANEGVSRSKDGRTYKWMARIVKDKTGINPLTISQTSCIGNTDESRLSIPQNSKANHFDIFVNHPITQFKYNRPVWRQSMGDEFVEIPRQYLRQPGWYILEARLESDDLNAVPMDRILYHTDDDVTHLMMPPGKYKLLVIALPYKGN
jgi:hypothetical protein